MMYYPISASLDGKVNPLKASLPAQLTLNIAEAGWPLPSQRQVSVQNTQIKIDGQSSDYHLEVRSRVNGEQIPDTSFSFNGVANQQRISLPKVVMSTLGGTANGSLLLGLGENYIWDTQWDLKNIDPSLQLPEITGKLNAKLRFNGQIKDQLWRMSLDEAQIEGELLGNPINFDAKLAKGFNNAWSIDKIKLNNRRNQIDIAGLISENWDIDAKIQLPQLGNLMPELSGSANAFATVTGAKDTPSLTIKSSASSVSYKEHSIKNFALTGQLNEILNAPSALALRIGRAQSGDQVIENIRLAIDGTRQSHELTLKAKGPYQSALDLSLSGSLKDPLAWFGMLEQVTLNVPEHEITLQKPTGLVWVADTDTALIDSHCWQSDNSNLCLQKPVIASNTGRATITLDQYPLQRANAFLQNHAELDGTLAMNATFDWGHTNGNRAAVFASIDNGEARMDNVDGEALVVAFDNLSLSSTLKPTELKSTLSLSSRILGDSNIDVFINPSLASKPLTGTVSINNIDLSAARAFFPDFDQLSGRLSASGELQGTVASPYYRGIVNLDDPVLRDETLPIAISGGELTANITGEKMFLTGNLLSDQGSIDVDGQGNLQIDNWDTDITLLGKDILFRYDPIQQASLFHNLNIKTNQHTMDVSGDIFIPNASINVEELPVGATTMSEDVVLIDEQQLDEAGQSSSGEQAIEPKFAINTALNIELGNQVTVSAYGLNANLTGEMDVRMRAPNPPQLGGEIQVVDGIFKQYGQDLEANGTVLFVGPVDATRLDIDAVREIDTEDRIAGLRIQGTVERPNISLFTEPSDKSQDSILSYIVLGRDINEDDGGDQDLLAAATLALAVKGGNTFGTGIANRLGVEQFEVETRGQGDNTELTVSGRLNDRLLLRYGRGVFDAQNSLYVRYDLTKKLYLEAAQSGTLVRAVDLFYSFAF